MRLWHVDIIPYLPNSQLIAQWRELNSIFKKRDKHILINYIYDYPDRYLLNYTDCVIDELQKRNITIRSTDKYHDYFVFTEKEGFERFAEHDDEYLTICYYNLKEKYLRGQNDFTDDVMWKLNEFYTKRRID